MCSPLPLSHPFRTENNSVSTPRPETEISHSIEEAGTPKQQDLIELGSSDTVSME